MMIDIIRRLFGAASDVFNDHLIAKSLPYATEGIFKFGQYYFVKILCDMTKAY